jgi:hypothetical protein
MSWGSSIFVGVLTAAVGAVVAGFFANLAVGWYRISSFEAGSAAFVVGFSVLGFVVCSIVGVVASRIIASGANPGFLKALVASHAVLLGIVAVVGVSARLLADVPPTIDGEELMLAVEVRWPEGTTTSPARLPGEPFVRLGSITGSNTQRASSRGPLWTTDAHLVDGHWVAPGAVDIFTTRGRFVIDVTPWMEWFLGCLTRAIEGAQMALSGVLDKARHWEKLRAIPLNERQRLVINKLIEGFDGKLTTSKWATLTKSSTDTALRDIQQLVERGVLVRNAGGGRSTSYWLAAL